MSDDQQPSQAEANKALRVLRGTPMKFTVRVHKADGSVIEWQADDTPKLCWDDPSRALWIKSSNYSEGHPIMPWEPGMILLCEPNPK